MLAYAYMENVCILVNGFYREIFKPPEVIDSEMRLIDYRAEGLNLA